MKSAGHKIGLTKHHYCTKSAETGCWAILENEFQLLVALTRVMAMQTSVFRTDVLFERSNGNFCKLVEMIGLSDSNVAGHIRRIT